MPLLQGGLGLATDGSWLPHLGQSGTRLKTVQEVLVGSGYWAGAVALQLG